MALALSQIETDLYRFITPSYPNIEIHVEKISGSDRIAIYFTDPKFALIYPYQRWHYLSHLIPMEYQDAHLQNSTWFELAPEEKPEELQYLDEELIDEITPAVMRCLVGSRFFEFLDDAMCPKEASNTRSSCWGDFRVSKPILLSRGFTEDEFFDVFHVLMRQGGFCDCEILYNVVEESRLKAEYWIAREEGRTPYDPHAG